MTNAEAEKILDCHVLQLRELGFDNVQVLVSWPSGCVTKGLYRGAGDWYARQGLAHEFIQRNIADDTASLIAEKLDKPDDGDAWKTEPA